MKKFILKFTTLFLIFYLASVVVDFVYSKIAAHSNIGCIEIWNDVLNGHIDADILVIGNSRVSTQVDPHIMDSILCVNTYDLAIDGGEINRQVLCYDVYCKYNQPPRLIIQNIDFLSLNYANNYQIDQYCPFFWNSEIRKAHFPVAPFSFCEKFIPLFRYHGINPAMFFHHTPKTKYKGYKGVLPPRDGNKYMEPDSIDFIANDTTVSVFEQFLADTKIKGIPVIFVYAPLYIGATTKIRNIEEMRMTYKAIADRYNVPILDYNDMWISSDDSFFYDALHLNLQGAEIYSDSLANCVKRLSIL